MKQPRTTMKLNSSLEFQNNTAASFNDEPQARLPLLMGVGLSLLLVLLALIGYRLPSVAPELYLALGIVLPAAILVWYYPAIGLIGIVFLTASLLRPDLVDVRLPIGGGFDLRDLTLIALLGVSVIRNFSFGRFTIPWFPVGGPLLLFLILAFASVANALFFKDVASNWALNDFRILLYYSLFFVTAWNIRTLSQLSTLLIGLFIVADLTAATVIIQQFRGPDNLFLDSMAYGQWQVWAQEDGTIRVVPPGHVLMHFMMVISYGLVLFNLSNWRRFLFFAAQFSFLSIGLLLTFTRAGWIASFVSLIIVTIVVVLRHKRQLPQLIVVGFALMLLLISAVGGASELGFIEGRSASSLQERFTSIFTPSETLESYSLQWRLFELNKATIAIQENPIFGVSLGNSYRNITTFQGEASGLWTDGNLSAGTVSRYTRYIHSSYLSITTKMGVTGILAYLWFCLAFIIYGRHSYKNTSNHQMKAVILTVIAGFIGLLQWSVFHAWLIEAESTSVIGIMVGMVAGLGAMNMRRSARRRSSSSAGSRLG